MRATSPPAFREHRFQQLCANSLTSGGCGYKDPVHQELALFEVPFERVEKQPAPKTAKGSVSMDQIRKAATNKCAIFGFESCNSEKLSS